jgi:uncharacterized SAM-binding protein YcdF (DUF218 family)
MESLFYLKKTLSFFIEPYGFVLFLIFLGLFHLYRSKFSKAKFYLSSSFVLLFLFAYPPFSNFLVKTLENVYPKFEATDANISYIHVLGSGNNDDKTQPLSSIIGDASMKRVVEGVEIAKENPKAMMIFTGYEGDSTLPNAVINSQVAQMLGIKEDRIISNSKAKDTKEEVVFSKRVAGDKKLVVCTSAMHMLRAIKLFRDAGLDPIPAPTDFKRRDIHTYLMKPDIESFENTQMAIHEYIGLLWAMIVH